MNLKHLGIIADGNRRWAKENNLPKIEGHKRGLKTIETLVEAAAKAGIPYVTFYVFSTENWGREKSEVNYIMKLAETKILKMAEKMVANNVKLLILGGATGPKIREAVENCTGEKPEIVDCGDLASAITAAVAAAKDGDVVLLSPASAAFDQFKNFMVRGAFFKKMIMEL